MNTQLDPARNYENNGEEGAVGLRKELAAEEEQVFRQFPTLKAES